MIQIKSTKEMFALDDGPMAYCVEQLVLNRLGDKVQMRRQDSIIGNRQVLVFKAQAENTLTEWSNGEHMLWTFCRSLAGSTEINLQHMASHLANGDEELAVDLIACFALLMGGGQR